MKRRNYGFFVAAALTVLSACSGSNGGSSEGYGPTTSDSLQVALANQDSLLSILNDISDGMAQIKQMENLLSTGGLGAETPDQRQQIREDMAQIQEALNQRRQRLEQLESQLAASNSKNATLQKAIKSLKAQIADQEQTISGLRDQLASANIQIEGLNESVNRLGQEKDSISNVAATETSNRQAAERQATEATNAMNTCYYAIGTGKELKAHHLLESGFLKSTKVLPNNFDASYFTVGDKRSLRTIPTGSKKAKVLTNQPSESYEIVEGANGMKIVKITNPTSFWVASNFLVIKTD
jgi:uncharacterized coiled-coil protein SlyX